MKDELVIIKNNKFSPLEKFEKTNWRPIKLTHDSRVFSRNHKIIKNKNYYSFLPKDSKSCLIINGHQNQTYLDCSVTLACHLSEFKTSITRLGKKLNIKVPMLLWSQILNLVYGGSRFQVSQLKADNKKIITRHLGIGNSFYGGICFGQNSLPKDLKSAHNLYWSSPFTTDYVYGETKDFEKTPDYPQADYRWNALNVTDGFLCKSHIDIVLVLKNSPFTSFNVKFLEWTGTKQKEKSAPIAIALGKYIDDEFKFVIPDQNGTGYCFTLPSLIGKGNKNGRKDQIQKIEV